MAEKAQYEQYPEGTFRIHIHILRHGEKSVADAVGQDADITATLTSRGRFQARQKGKMLSMKHARIVGSPRARTRETAAHVVSAHDPAVTGEESFDTLLQKINKNPRTLKALDMAFDKDDSKVMGVVDSLLKEKRYLSGLAEIDAAMTANGEDHGTSIYAKQVVNFATLLERYLSVAGRLARTKNRTPASHEIVMGSHAAVVESFLAEVIRATDGEAERARFLRTIPNGFDYVEGADFEIEAADSKSSQPKLRISFSVGGDEKFVYDRVVHADVVSSIRKAFLPKDDAQKAG